MKAKVIANEKLNYGIGNLDIEEIDYPVIMYFDSAKKGQEFVIDANEDVLKWVEGLIK